VREAVLLRLPEEALWKDGGADGAERAGLEAGAGVRCGVLGLRMRGRTDSGRVRHIFLFSFSSSTFEVFLLTIYLRISVPSNSTSAFIMLLLAVAFLNMILICTSLWME
jgi:hypothetical protein